MTENSIKSIKLIVGLGNPGTEYARSRHNLGYDLLNMLAERHRISLREEPKFFGIAGRGDISGHEVRMLFPTTFMNLSGKSVSALAGFYKIAPEEILVLHDELDLLPGTARLKIGGGTGGHNGLKSIVSSMGNSQNFCRLRIGIGKPGNHGEVIGFVLGTPAPAEKKLIDAALDEALECIDIIFSQNLARATNRLNSFKANKE